MIALDAVLWPLAPLWIGLIILLGVLCLVLGYSYLRAKTPPTLVINISGMSDMTHEGIQDALLKALNENVRRSIYRLDDSGHIRSDQALSLRTIENTPCPAHAGTQDNG